MSDANDEPASVAIEQLESFGLSTYAARTFVALVSLGEGSAKDVSRVSEVPRTRVYDAIEELREWGLVDVRQTTPMEFWVPSIETSGRQFRQEFNHRADVLTNALDRIETSPRSSEQPGIWTVTGTRAIEERILEFVATATEEVVFMTIDDFLSDDVVGELAAASDRGASIVLAGLSEETYSDIETSIPTAERFGTLWDRTDEPAGRLLLVDGEKALISVVADNAGEREETALWARGANNGLVFVLEMVFTWRRNESTV
jgi:sugar-specific transcriptional regulator TrmB